MESGAITSFFAEINGLLPERFKRTTAAVLAKALGHGGVKQVAEQSGISRSTILRGIKLLESGREKELELTRQRQDGGGRKGVHEKTPEIMEALNRLIEPYVNGNPESPLRWTSKSLRKLSGELNAAGISASHVSVGRLLEEMGYTLQSCKKSHEGVSSPDRNEQFERINTVAQEFMNENQPVISVDAKKKELVGNFKNNGREYHPKGEAPEVNVYDFIGDSQGKAIPYGVYDIKANEGFVNLGSTHDTAEFAVESIARWWKTMGMKRYPDAHSLFITADGGGSNGSRNRLWKSELQKFANEFNLQIVVSHFPPGTSKWNKIEHRMFSAISINWRGKVLETFEVIVNLIENTTNRSGLKMTCKLDSGNYEAGKKILDMQMQKLKMIVHDFHPQWNYAILPQKEL